MLAWSDWANPVYTAISSRPQLIAGDWPQVPSEESPPKQALHQLTPGTMADIQISLRHNQQANANPEQHHVNASRYTERTPEMAAQYSMSGRDDVVLRSEPRPASPSANSEGSCVMRITRHGTKRHSVPVMYRAHLPSPGPVEQIPPGEACPSPDALRGATRNGHRRPVRPVGTMTGSKGGGARTEEPAGQQKRRFGMGSTPALEDGVSARTAKRAKLRATHNSALGRDHDSVAKTKPDRSPYSESEDELAITTPTKPVGTRLTRPRGTSLRSSRTASSPRTPDRIHSRLDSISQGGIQNVSRRGQPITPRTRPSTPVSNNPSLDAVHCLNVLGERSCGLSLSAGQMQKDDCHACGFSARRLLQMTDRAWRWLPKDDAVFEALFKNKDQLVDTEKCAVMLRLCLGTIRDYGMGLAAAENQPNDAVQPIVALPGPGETVDSVLLPSDNFFSDGDSQCDSNIPESPKNSSDSDVTSVWQRGQNCGGKRARWTPLEECRLKTWMKERPWPEEDQKWQWIATRLRRSETAVKQHWMIMGRSKVKCWNS